MNGCKYTPCAAFGSQTMHRQYDPPAREPRTSVVGLRDTTAERHLRAGDDDRSRVTDLLQAHYVAGRLTQSELEARLQEAVAARTLADLDVLLADLPDIATSPPPTSQQEQQRTSHAGRQRDHAGGCGERSFRAHATSYLLVMALLVAIWALTSPGGYFWPIWPMLGWGIGLASHGLAERNKAASDGRGHWRSLGSH